MRDFINMDLDEFFHAISLGFQSSRSEVIAFGSILLGFIVFLIIVGRLIQRHENRHLRRRLTTEFSRRIAELGLDNTEISLIDRMADFLGNKEKKYLLLVNPNTFLSALRQLKQNEEVPPRVIEAVTQKLGFANEELQQIPMTTQGLQSGITVTLVAHGGRRFKGICDSIREEGLVVTYAEEHRFRVGQPLLILSHTYQGLHVFKTKILEESKGRILLEHTERQRFIRRSHNSTFHHIPAYVRHTGRGRTPVKVEIRDFTNRGAYLTNPEKTFRTGDDLKIYFRPGPGKLYPLNAEVEKTSLRRHLIKVKFGHLDRTKLLTDARSAAEV
jgi:hypothetical protein